MIFEVGKFYRMRNGNKAQVFLLDNGEGLMLGTTNEGGIWYNTAWYPSGDSVAIGSKLDLKEEWKEPIKYSVELWGNDFSPDCRELSLHRYVFGCWPNWNKTATSNCPKKYRVTVEEIVE